MKGGFGSSAEVDPADALAIELSSTGIARSRVCALPHVHINSQGSRPSLCGVMFHFCCVQIIRAPAPEKLLDEGRATLNKFKEEQKQRAGGRSITGQLRSSVKKSRSRLFKAAEAEPGDSRAPLRSAGQAQEPSAARVPSVVPQPSQLSAMSAVGWENNIVDVEVGVSCMRNNPAKFRRVSSRPT